jgi:tRNA dimethylallyltransferase
MKPIIVITGPTAVGKTALSIDLARKFNGEIINADASQMRRDLNIGTAKISIDEMKNVKHHLIDFLDPLDKFSIKEFQKIGRDLIDKIEIPFIVGGSGLYIQALITDYQLDTSSRDESQFDNLSNEELHTLLKEQDSEAAVKIHPNNRRRVSRYLEIIRDRGKVQTSHPIPLYDVLTICLTTDRKILYDNINKRCDQMFVNGWIEECLDLKNKGIDLSLIK